MDHLCNLCLVFVLIPRLFIAALLSPAGIGLTFWLSFVMFNCVFVTFQCGIPGQVWYLIVLIPDLCHLSYFVNMTPLLRMIHVSMTHTQNNFVRAMKLLRMYVESILKSLVSMI